MKIEFTRGTVWSGQAYDAGQIIEVSDADANWLIHRGKAKAFVETVKAPLTDRKADVEKTTSQPKSTKRFYKKG